jgi:hypothetical protein
MLDGLGIATCCHHLCQWSSYISKSLREALTTLDFICSGSRLEITVVSKQEIGSGAIWYHFLLLCYHDCGPMLCIRCELHVTVHGVQC